MLTLDVTDRHLSSLGQVEMAPNLFGNTSLLLAEAALEADKGVAENTPVDNNDNQHRIQTAPVSTEEQSVSVF